ncbi:MAG TPA: hypothetical protein VFM62_00265 [Arthrobacter sp.]|nr:hypothetical protein [Arthrobacter sp.]
MSVLLEEGEARPVQGGRRRRVFIPLAILAFLAASLGYLFLTTSEPEPSAPLGASVTVPGGMAGITGVMPLEVDGWEPPAASAIPGTPPQEGAHRVRVQVRLTALDAAGLRYDPQEYFVDGIGSGQPHALWSSPSAQQLDQGETITATMVFELPDKAIALVLENEAGARLSLGSEHHTGGP